MLGLLEMCLSFVQDEIESDAKSIIIIWRLNESLERYFLPTLRLQSTVLESPCCHHTKMNHAA
jgi:hypothetical protein